MSSHDVGHGGVRQRCQHQRGQAGAHGALARLCPPPGRQLQQQRQRQRLASHEAPRMPGARHPSPEHPSPCASAHGSGHSSATSLTEANVSGGIAQLVSRNHVQVSTTPVRSLSAALSTVSWAAWIQTLDKPTCSLCAPPPLRWTTGDMHDGRLLRIWALPEPTPKTSLAASTASRAPFQGRLCSGVAQELQSPPTDLRLQVAVAAYVPKQRPHAR